MAGKRTEMSKIKQILLLHKDGMSNRKIGERLGLYKETVNKYVNAAKSDSKSIEELIKMEEPDSSTVSVQEMPPTRTSALMRCRKIWSTMSGSWKDGTSQCSFYGKNTDRNIRTVTDTRSSVIT